MDVVSKLGYVKSTIYNSTFDTQLFDIHLRGVN